MESASKRADLIKAAYQLFEENGFHATGVDVIVEKAQTTKRTLYRTFGSKENLALEVLKDHDEQFRRVVRSKTNIPSIEAKERLLALFDYYGEWFESEKFHGCIFIRAMVEFESGSRVLKQAARESKELLRQYIEQLCDDAGANDSNKLADQLQIMLEGAIIVAQAKASAQSANTAKEMASILIERATT